jgi:hypothetical protein
VVLDRGVVYVIDFRYHLVSIVSIFMALAVGIVLGAGPLKESIGNRLNEQVTALRTEKAQLRTDLDTAKRGTSARDTYSSAVAPTVMRNQLSGKTVALVVTPGVEADLVKDTTASLVLAGAKVGSTVTLTDVWADPAKRSFRSTLANQLAGLVKVPLGTNSPDQLAAAVLARAILVGTEPSTAPSAAAASQALQGLKEGDLVKVAPDQIVRSSSVVVLTGPVKGSTQEETDARLAAYVQLIRSLEAGGSGSVVATASNPDDQSLSGDLVAAVRKDAAVVKVTSTVDDADLPMGQGTIVLALALEHTGGGGQYGLAADAQAIAPKTTARQ